MQNEFKERILSYLVGDINPETTPDNCPTIEQTDYISTSLEELKTENNLNPNGIIRSQNGLYVVYGRIGDTYDGFILLLDSDFGLIKLFKTYEGGTTLPYIEYLKQDEDGYFYGTYKIYNTSWTGGLLMLNNFTLTLTGEYNLKFRHSYTYTQDIINMMNNGSTINGGDFVPFKKQGEAKYLFAGRTKENNDSTNYIDMATVQINVGSENEWTYVRSSLITDTIVDIYSKLYCDWLEDDYRVKFGYNTYDSSYTNSKYYVEKKWINGVLTSSLTYSLEADNYTSISMTSIAMKNFNTTYAGAYYTTTGYSESQIYKFDGNVNGNNLIFSYPHMAWISIMTTNNIVIAYSSFDGTNTEILFIDNNQVYNIGEVNRYYGVYSYGFINNTYNLYTLVMWPQYWSIFNDESVDKLKFTYNEANYNGDSYLDYNSMVPNSAKIYSNNDLVFARNLYNKIINQNTTESIVEIPNEMLNDITLDKEELYSETNSLLNQENTQINKNIYESVYLNFFNTINMSNQNDPNNPIINIAGASRLNKSISGNNYYNNVKIGIKINYDDSTSEILGGFSFIKNSTISYTLYFNLYVLKEISNIQFISNDGQTVYQEINPTLEIGKIYKISQNVRIV